MSEPLVVGEMERTVSLDRYLNIVLALAEIQYRKANETRDETGTLADYLDGLMDELMLAFEGLSSHLVWDEDLPPEPEIQVVSREQVESGFVPVSINNWRSRREEIAAAIYAGDDEAEWIATVDGSPNAAAYEYANRALDSKLMRPSSPGSDQSGASVPSSSRRKAPTPSSACG